MGKLGRLCGIFVCGLVLALAACGGNAKPGGGTGSTNQAPGAGQNSNQVLIVPGKATPSTVTIQQGKNVEFTVRQGNPDETICLGSNQQCASNASGPSSLQGPTGMQVLPGTTQTVTFNNPGTYHITSLSYSGVNVTIIVQ